MDSFVSQIPIDLKLNGFVDLTETTLSFNDQTYLLTLTAVNTNWSIYRLGKRHTLQNNKGVNISIGTPADGTYYISINSHDGTLISGTSKITGNIQVAEIVWTTANNPKYVLSDKRDVLISCGGGSLSYGTILEKTTTNDNDTIVGFNSENSNSNSKWKLSTLKSYVLNNLSLLASKISLTANGFTSTDVQSFATEIWSKFTATRFAVQNSNIFYVGIAPLNSLDSATVWKIKKIVVNSDGTNTITNATNVAWTNYLTANYS